MCRELFYLILALVVSLVDVTPAYGDDIIWDFENGNDHGFTLWSVNPATPAADDPTIAGDEALTGVGGPRGLPDAGVAWSVGRPDQFDGQKPAVSEGDKTKADGTMEYNQPGKNHPFTFPVNSRGQESYLNTYNLTGWGDNVHTAANDQIATSPLLLIGSNAQLTVWVHGGGNGTHAPELDSNPDEGYTANSAGVAVISAADGSLLSSVLTNGHGTLREDTIDLSEFVGQMVHIEVVDAFQGGWGWIAVDEIRITNAVELGGSGPYPKAWGPNPADGALHTDTWVNLSWIAGGFAVSHDVYLGDNFDDVNDGVESVFQGNQTITSLLIGFPGFAFPDGLVPGTTYYWRIDEVNDADPNSPWKGDVWSFTIPPKKAYDPNPTDGTKFVNTNVELSWTEGFGAKLHHLYFGDNFDDVNNGVVGLPQATTAYTPGTLELEKTYYWRIDEFDGLVTHKGDVWSFKTIPVIAITDPDLVGWWKLDEGMGTTAVDFSGHDHHGTISGPDWVAGYDGDALDFITGENDRVSAGSFDVVGNGITMAAWINPRSFTVDDARIISKASSSGGNDHWWMLSTISDTGEIRLRFRLKTDDGQDTTTYIAGALVAGEWAHVAATWDGSTMLLYKNGLEVGRTAKSGTAVATSPTVKVAIGNQPAGVGGGTRDFDGLIDDVRVYNRGLTAAEILDIMRGDPRLAWNPGPANWSTPYIKEATPLSWSPGENASGHDVYFGIDKNAVDDADESNTTGIYRGRQSVTIYTPPEVEWGGGPYYWRIDEYNTDATISKGRIWSFTVADFIGIDDIEDYNDYPPDEIFSTWIDGWEDPTNGSMAGHAEPPFAETTIVHGGRQSMPVYYENNFKYSEATMTLVSARDWTEEGVGVLSLWFYGDSANAAEQMYVNLNGIATVYHDNPDAALIEEWTQWTIDLQEFAAQGVNLANVNTITIGFGDKNNLQAGGSGMVFFDDFRLYRLTP